MNVFTVSDPIVLGRQTENGICTLQFPIARWIKTYGEGGDFHLWVKRPHETDPYPVVISNDDEYVYWIPTASDLLYSGYGSAELIYSFGVAGEATYRRAASEVFTTKIQLAIAGNSSVPAAQQAWVTQVESYAVRAEEAVEVIQDMTATASADNVTGIPSVVVTKTETEESFNLDFAFHNIKGNTGSKGDKGDRGIDGLPGPQGPQGPAGAAGKVQDVKLNNVSILNESDKIAYLTVTDSLDSTSTTASLSANMGKSLQDQVNNLKNIGRFLSIWNSSTGLPETNPVSLPYTYNTGDYFRVGTVASGSANNYKPEGTQYTGTASVTVETNPVQVGAVYYFDGTTWKMQASGGGGTVQDVQINGTTIIQSGTGVANIPLADGDNSGVISDIQVANNSILDDGVANVPVAGTSSAGVVQINSQYGIMMNGAIISVYAADNSVVDSKTDAYRPLVSANINEIIKSGLGNYSGTSLSTAEKSTARSTIGAVALEEYNSSATSYADNTLYYIVD